MVTQRLPSPRRQHQTYQDKAVLPVQTGWGRPPPALVGPWTAVPQSTWAFLLPNRGSNAPRSPTRQPKDTKP